MSFLSNWFSKKKHYSIQSNIDFWEWFVSREKDFFKVLAKGEAINEGFFEYLDPKLKQLNKEYWYLCGMLDGETAELIITPEGRVNLIHAVENLVNDAPELRNWKFTALKPPMGIENTNIKMDGYLFGKDTLKFYPIIEKEYPDDIILVISHKDFSAKNESLITNGVFLFLDNYLGELTSVTMLDEIRVIHPNEAMEELIPIEKLKSYVIWREKEFVEKYNEVRANTEESYFMGLERTLNDGKKVIATVNRDLIEWDAKASHPWVSIVTLGFDEAKNGLPDESLQTRLNQIDDELLDLFQDDKGELWVASEIGNNIRRLYFAFADFRKPSEKLNGYTRKSFDGFTFEFDIFKDKYWRAMEKFSV